MPPSSRFALLLVCLAIACCGRAASAAPFDQRVALVAAQLERALERQSVGAPTPESDSAVTRAIGAVRALAPSRSASGSPGERRFHREWLAARLGPRANASAAVWGLLLPDGSRIPLGASDDPTLRTGMLLDAVLRDATAIERGAATGDLVLELRDATFRSDLDTRVLARVPSEYATGTRRSLNPEYVHRQTELVVALSDVARAEADDRADPGLLTGLSVLLTNATADRARRDLERTPAVIAEPEFAPYEARRVEARATAEARAIALLRDRRTGHADTLAFTGSCERRAEAFEGVRDGDRRGLVRGDAAAALPDARALEAFAFDDLRERARAPVTDAVGRALLARAEAERKDGRMLEALGLALLARDCGATAPRWFVARLAPALASSPSQLAALDRAARRKRSLRSQRSHRLRAARPAHGTTGRAASCRTIAWHVDRGETAPSPLPGAGADRIAKVLLHGGRNNR